MITNLFGTIERARYIFRDSLDHVRQLIEAKIDPRAILKNPTQWFGTAQNRLHAAAEASSHRASVRA